MTHPDLALLLLLFLLLIMPVWGWLDVRRLKRDNVPAALTRSYLTTIGVMWLLAIVSAMLIPARTLWDSPAGLAAAMNLTIVPASAMIGIMVGLLIGLIAPVIIIRRKPPAAERQLEKIRFLLPTTIAQRWLFVLVCVTAGVAEEWIYRGFLLHYLVGVLPGVNGWWIVLIAAAMFGIAHAYQGKTGTVLTGVLGFIFCVLYIRMGSLLLPMILHALVDLRIFLLLPNTTKVSPA
jgi:membrane protease YdiL (CAAX protease family)